jgi:hypothetical protein
MLTYADWRMPGIRQLRKDWRRKDASVDEQIQSLAVMAEATFCVGEVYMHLTYDKRMRTYADVC